MLAMYGVDESGELYVHIKIYKQGRVYGEVYYTGGMVQIKCRVCYRWNRVVFTSQGTNPLAELCVTDPPPVVAEIPPVQ